MNNLRRYIGPPNLRHIDLNGYPELFGFIAWIALGLTILQLILIVGTGSMPAEAIRLLVTGVIIYFVSAIQSNYSLIKRGLR